MDFVLPWVDPADPKWIQEFSHYSPNTSGDAGPARYRDWGTLRYWFRGVERFAPWVNTIHFVTSGHLPKWLNTAHPQLHVVFHNDYIPRRYLPTFNARPIELNFHRIKSLSDEYVYFNDDMFLLRPVAPEFFFRRGLPCDQAAMNVLSGGEFQRTLLEDVALLKTHLRNKHRAMFRHPLHWFNPRYGTFALYNALLSVVSRHYTGFVLFHLPQALRKATLSHLWEIAYDELDYSCRQRFCDYSTVNVYVQRYWQMAIGQFHPVSMARRGLCIQLSTTSVGVAEHFIRRQTRPLLCVNDDNSLHSFSEASARIQAALEHIFPTPSKFEL